MKRKHTVESVHGAVLRANWWAFVSKITRKTSQRCGGVPNISTGNSPRGNFYAREDKHTHTRTHTYIHTRTDTRTNERECPYPQTTNTPISRKIAPTLRAFMTLRVLTSSLPLLPPFPTLLCPLAPSRLSPLFPPPHSLSIPPPRRPSPSPPPLLFLLSEKLLLVILSSTPIVPSSSNPPYRSSYRSSSSAAGLSVEAGAISLSAADAAAVPGKSRVVEEEANLWGGID